MLVNTDNNNNNKVVRRMKEEGCRSSRSEEAQVTRARVYPYTKLTVELKR